MTQSKEYDLERVSSDVMRVRTSTARLSIFSCCAREIDGAPEIAEAIAKQRPI
jgi:hypothetical protein